MVKVAMKKTDGPATRDDAAGGELRQDDASLEKASNGKIVRFRKKKALPDGRA
jgi:hypothetical protein